MKTILLFCVGLLLSGHFFVMYAQWEGPIQGSPTSVHAICFIDSLTGFASAGKGPLRTNDGGATWQAMELSGQPSFHRYRFRSHDVGLVVGDSGVVFKTTDGGASWTSRASGTTDNLRDVTFGRASEVWWACGDNVILHSTDDGESWTANSNLPGFGALRSISFRTAQDGWVVGLWGRALHCTDQGGTWNSWEPPVQTLYFGIRWLTSTRGVMIPWWPIWVSTDAGANWMPKLDGQGGELLDLDFADSLNGWVVGLVGQLFHTTDGGDSWELQTSPWASEAYEAVSCINPRMAWAGGSAGVYRTTNGGGTSGVSGTGAILPQDYALEQNYPNPFNPSTRIKYTVGVAGGKRQVASVRLAVYDLLGRQVATLVDEEKAPGSYEVSFDASGLASGVYVYRLTAGSYVQSRKMVLLR